jgi:hypothetical protein
MAKFGSIIAHRESGDHNAVRKTVCPFMLPCSIPRPTLRARTDATYGARDAT